MSNSIDISQLLNKETIQLSHAERKDGWITKVALFVIGFAATISGLALVVSIFSFDCDQAGSCSFPEPPKWSAEMLRLSLVSSLAFVMGTNSGN